MTVWIEHTGNGKPKGLSAKTMTKCKYANGSVSRDWLPASAWKWNRHSVIEGLRITHYTIQPDTQGGNNDETQPER